ncbi:MAG: hypothetical protein ACR2RE_29985 [Geminicoccaceae bacterium]
MTDHTPGPWIWESFVQENCVTEHTLKGPDVLCRCWYDKPPSADAHLIAAAPDLFNALEACAEVLGIRDDFVPLGPAVDIAPIIRAAIAKAKRE